MKKLFLFTIDHCNTCTKLIQWMLGTRTLHLVTVVKVYDGDGNIDDRCMEYDVFDGPTLIVVEDGKVVARHAGGREVTPLLISRYNKGDL